MDYLKATSVSLSSENFTHQSVNGAGRESVKDFSSIYGLAQTSAVLPNRNSEGGTRGAPSSTKIFPINSNLEQNLRINNAAASLTGSEPGIHERALALRAYRQELLASNIANADTPNYKAVDIDVKEALQNNTPLSQVAIKYSNNRQASVDGNTVDMDVERVKFMENSLMYEYAVDEVRGEFKSMSELLQNLPY